MTSSTSATLLFVRHGESVANSEHRFSRQDDEPLTPLGVEQARTTGRRIAAECASTSVPVVAIYASPFARALETGREIGCSLGLEPEVVLDLREQSFGSMAGQPYLELYSTLAGLPVSDLWTATAPGGESLRQVAARVGPAVDQIAARHRGECALVVSHGGVMAALRGLVLGNFSDSPRSTENAWGFRLVGAPETGYGEPMPLVSNDQETTEGADRAAARHSGPIASAQGGIS